MHLENIIQDLIDHHSFDPNPIIWIHFKFGFKGKRMGFNNNYRSLNPWSTIYTFYDFGGIVVFFSAKMLTKPQQNSPLLKDLQIAGFVVWELFLSAN